MKLGRARIVNMNQGPEYGDASACLKITYSGDPARPAGHMFKMRAPSEPSECRIISDSLSGRRHLPESSLISIEVTLDLPGRHMSHVVAPLLTLGSDEVVEDVLAQRALHQGALFQFVERFAQV